MQQSAVIEYNHDGYQCEGFAVWDAAGPNRPGILVFPEWVGVGDAGGWPATGCLQQTS